MISIEELTERDIALLRISRGSVVKKLWYAGVVALVMSFLIPLLPWRHGKLEQVFPYPVAVSALALTFGFIIGRIYLEEKRKLEKDIRYGKKIKCHGVVTERDESSFMGKKYYLCISLDDNGDKRIRVSKEEYARIEPGTKASLEYAQLSMTFLRMNING